MGWNFFTSSGEIKRVSKSASTVSETAPPNPANGDLWTNASNMVTYVYYSDGSSSQWVEAANNARPTTMYGTVANRPAASTTGLYYYATDTKQVFIDSGSAWVEVTKPTYETSLPASPYDGQEIYYAASTASGVIWHLRYRSGSSSSYKWEFVGGQSLATIGSTSTYSTSSTSYVALSEAIEITLPFAGDYRVEHGWSKGYGGQYIFQTVKIGSAAASEDNALNIENAAGYWTSAMTPVFATGVSANTVLALQNRVSASQGNWQRRWLAARPVRVG